MVPCPLLLGLGLGQGLLQEPPLEEMPVEEEEEKEGVVELLPASPYIVG
jgi:hypothetical protein